MDFNKDDGKLPEIKGEAEETGMSIEVQIDLLAEIIVSQILKDQ